MPEFDNQCKFLMTLQHTITCKMSFKHMFIGTFKQLLSTHNTMYGNTEQKNYLQAFNVICDILDEAIPELF